MILSRLKSETREHHLRVERDLGIMDRNSACSSYGARAVASLRVPSQLGASGRRRCSQDETFFGPRRKLHLIARDLDALGHRADAARARMADRFPALGDGRGRDRLALRAGRRDAGRPVHRQARRARASGCRAAQGSAYFRSYGKQVAERWRAFQARPLAASSPTADDAIVACGQCDLRAPARLALRSRPTERVRLAGRGELWLRLPVDSRRRSAGRLRQRAHPDARQHHAARHAAVRGASRPVCRAGG